MVLLKCCVSSTCPPSVAHRVHFTRSVIFRKIRDYSACNISSQTPFRCVCPVLAHGFECALGNAPFIVHLRFCNDN